MTQTTHTTYVGRQVFGVTGMTCDHCRRAVTEELSQIAAVDDVEVDVATGTVSLTARAPVTRAELAAAVDEAGYTLGDAR